MANEWAIHFEFFAHTRDIVTAWQPADPDPTASRCEHSRHRTLGHLRACQEQWLDVVEQFLERPNPSVTVQHPWRKFDQEAYAALSWDEHLSRFLEDRERWMQLRNRTDLDRGGKMNREPETAATLTRRHALHEVHHICHIRG